MSKQAFTVEQLSDLRMRAVSRLTGGAGAAPLTATEALAVLHELASSPDTAPDALALLHELQVHQVELDLQSEELRESRLNLESALQRQIELYDFQPVGCFTIDRSFTVHELNLTAARMLGVGRDEARGLLLDGFLSPPSARTMHELIASIATGKASAAPALQLISKDGTDRVVRAHVGADPTGQRFLVVLANAGEDPAARAASK